METGVDDSDAPSAPFSTQIIIASSKAFALRTRPDPPQPTHLTYATYATEPGLPAFARASCPTRATAGKPDPPDLRDRTWPTRLRSRFLSDASYGGQARPS